MKMILLNNVDKFANGDNFASIIAKLNQAAIVSCVMHQCSTNGL